MSLGCKYPGRDINPLRSLDQQPNRMNRLWGHSGFTDEDHSFFKFFDRADQVSQDSIALDANEHDMVLSPHEEPFEPAQLIKSDRLAETG